MKPERWSPMLTGVLALVAGVHLAAPALAKTVAPKKGAARTAATAAKTPAPADSGSITDVLGDWHGRSDCMEKGGSCHDETVQYHFTPLPGRPDSVQVDAEKLVAGSYYSMGIQALGYARATRTWAGEFHNARVHVLMRFQIVKGELAGTMVDLTSGAVERRMSARPGLDPAVRR